MGLMLLKKIGVLVLLILASVLLSTSLAGRPSKFVNDLDAPQKEVSREQQYEEEVSILHKRLLRVNTKDYGRYDPPPTLDKPPFKLIPN